MSDENTTGIVAALIGRRPLSPARKRRKALVIRCRVEDLERWHRAAALADSPPSELARDLLDAWADGVIAEHDAED